MVKTTEIVPSPHLQLFVQRFAYREFDTRGFELRRPLPAMCEFLLTFNLDNSNTTYIQAGTEANQPSNSKALTSMDTVISGINNQYNGVLVFNGRFRIFSIQFNPSGFYGIFGIPATSFTNEVIDGYAVFSKKLATLNQQLQDSNSIREMVAHSEQFLTACLLKSKRSDKIRKMEYTANLLLHSMGTVSMEKLAAAACMSMKTFERRFTEEIGVAPKLFARMARFNKAISLKVKDEKQSWTSIAHTCGYYDQMHFIKEFRLFTGETPTAFFRCSPPPKEHLMQEEYQSG